VGLAVEVLRLLLPERLHGLLLRTRLLLLRLMLIMATL